MSMYTQPDFMSAVDRVRLRGVEVQHAKGIDAWHEAVAALHVAQDELNSIILHGLNLDAPEVPLIAEPEPVVDAEPDAPPSAISDDSGGHTSRKSRRSQARSEGSED